MLGSLLIGIIGSLFGMLVGVLAAIFIVEKYLQRQRAESERKQAELGASNRAYWQAYIHGGVAFWVVQIMVLSLFVAYGRKRFVELIGYLGDTSGVPEAFGDFRVWMLESLENDSRLWSPNTAALGEESLYGNREAVRLEKTFMELSPSAMSCTVDDLDFLFRFIRHIDEVLHDFLLLFHPFMARQMEFGTALVELHRSLLDICDHTELRLRKSQRDETQYSILLSEQYTSSYCKLGQKAARLQQLISSQVRYM